MTFSLAGSVITQANEAGIAITAAASIAGGVRFTCTQSYAVGNLIRITGTTNYNDDWLVSAVTGTTFDVTTSARGNAITFVSSQTGTAARGDSSLSGIAAIAGVTTRAINQGYLVTHTTYLMNLQIVVTGSLRIRPRLEMLEFGTTAPFQELRVNSGGRLTVEERYGATYGTHQWKRITRIRTASEAHWTIGGASMVVASGGTFNWAGGSTAVTGLWNQGTTTIDSGVLNGQAFNNGGAFQDSSYLFDNGGTVTINSLVIGRSVLLVSWAGVGRTYTNLSGTPGGYEGEGNPAQGGTLTGVYTLVNLPDSALGFRVLSTRQGRVTIVNSVQGSSTTQLVSFNDSVTNFPNGRIEFRKRITFQYSTTALAAIQNVHVFMRDTNNGLRSNRTNDNYVNDRTYLSTSNASGLTSQLEIMTATVRPLSSGSTTLVYDRRSVSNDENDVFRVGSHAYTHLLSDLSIPMRGTGDLTQGVTMFSDNSVTLSQASAAALATIATLNNFYDAAKDWKCQANATRLEYPTLFTQPASASGTAVSLGSLNVLIDATAATAFAINTTTNVITVKSSSLAVGSKFNELSTSGNITFANGGTATCRLSGSLSFATPGAINLSLGTATLTFTTAGTYNLRNANITGTLTLINTSGGAVTVQLQPGVSFVNTGPNITVDNAVSASLIISNIVSGSQILIRRTDTQAVLLNSSVAGTSVNYSYTYTADIPVEIVVRKATASPYYQEWRTTSTLTATSGLLTANQILDE